VLVTVPGSPGGPLAKGNDLTLRQSTPLLGLPSIAEAIECKTTGRKENPDAQAHHVVDLAAALLALSLSFGGAALAAEQHPGQHTGGNPHTTNPCESDNNNPNCPGGF
jgi:hypothetical protein